MAPCKRENARVQFAGEKIIRRQTVANEEGVLVPQESQEPQAPWVIGWRPISGLPPVPAGSRGTPVFVSPSFNMSNTIQCQAYATSLLADVRAAAKNTLPRREDVLTWLADFLARCDRKGYHTQPAEAENLSAIDDFLRASQVPFTVRATLA
jgi:hypothetical protein